MDDFINRQAEPIAFCSRHTAQRTSRGCIVRRAHRMQIHDGTSKQTAYTHIANASSARQCFAFAALRARLRAYSSAGKPFVIYSMVSIAKMNACRQPLNMSK